MTLSPGTRLGVYEVTALLGAGGMGEVYKARDTRLDRTVAVKVLAPQLAEDPLFRERFHREARSISHLAHPNICTLYDVGSTPADRAPGTSSGAQEIHFLVLEYLEGETLAARLARGRLALPDVLRIATEIASALDNAHRHGIVHRDLKPGNVLLARAIGSPVPASKLLDFGLAKIGVRGTPSTDVTTAVTNASLSGGDRGPMTAQGTLLGTLQYMAPEQIEGQDADARTDIFAFGATLYEMLTGRKAFDGKSQASLLGAILKDDPPPATELQRATPPPLDYLVRTCLAKDPDARFQTMHDVWLQLKWVADAGSASGLAAPVAGRRAWPRRAMWATGTVGLAALSSVAAWWLKPAPLAQRAATQLEYQLPDNQVFTGGTGQMLALSPDGSLLAYVANQQLHVRALNRIGARPLAGTNEDPTLPVFSPDGQWIAYFVASSGGSILKKIAVSGGAPQRLAELAALPLGAACWHGSSILVGVNTGLTNGIQSVADAGGMPTTIISVAGNERASNPQVLEDGRHVMFTVEQPGVGSRIVVQASGESDRRVLIEDAIDGREVATGRILYRRGETLLSAPFDVGRLAVGGDAVQLVDGVAHFDVSDSGVLVYRPGSGLANSGTLVWVDRNGLENPISARAGVYRVPRLSADGTKLAASSLFSAGALADIWVWTFGNETLTNLTSTENVLEFNPLWTAGDQQIVFDAREGDAIQIRRKAADGTGAAEVVRQAPAGYPEALLPDGRGLIYHTPLNLSMVSPLGPGGDTRPLVPTKRQLFNAEISPDGHWVAYQSDESSRFEIYVRPFPSIEKGQRQVSTNGGTQPLWSRTGTELYFIAGTMMMSAPVRLSPEFWSGRPEGLFPTINYRTNLTARNYDAAADGKRFVMVKAAESAAGLRASLVIMTNWVEAVRDRTGAGRSGR